MKKVMLVLTFFISILVAPAMLTAAADDPAIPGAPAHYAAADDAAIPGAPAHDVAYNEPPDPWKA